MPVNLNDITLEQIQELDDLQAKQNNGRGITCVKDIVFYFTQGHKGIALQVRQSEGDKTRSYPEVELKLTELFGCRMHGEHNCQDELCKFLQSYLERDMKC